MPFGRRRPLMRAAIVGGAAYHVGKNVQGGRDADAERDARMDDLEQQQQMQQQAPAAPAPAGGITDDAIEQIQKLGALKEQGLITDDEFEEQKRKLLGG